MADQKVSDLPSLNGADVDPADLLYIVDSSAGTAGSKKITVGQFQIAPFSGSTADTVLYLNGSKVLSSSSALTFDGTNFATTGTATATKFIPTGNVTAGNGMYLPAANNLAWSINGSEQMRLTSTGLGIGTSSPSVKLHVASSGSEQLRVEGTTATGYTSMNLYGTGRRYAVGVGNASETALGLANNFYIYDSTVGVTRVVLDTSGNLGLGVTPSATGASQKSLEIGGLVGIVANPASNTSSAYAHNAYYNGTNWIYKNTSVSAARYEMTGANSPGSTHAWYVAAGGTAGNTISFTQAMTLTSGGDLLVGTVASSSARLYVRGSGTTSATASFEAANSSGATRFYVQDDGTTRFFGSSGSETARITSGGDLLVGTTTGSFHRLHKSIAGDFAVQSANTSATTPYGHVITFTAAAPNDATSMFLRCDDTGLTGRIQLRSNGGIANYQANDVNLSDRREKTNFAPAKSYLDTICAIPVQTFNYIDQSPDDPGLTLGVVAQDVQAVAPELVMESNWGTEDNPKMRLSIYQTDLQYALMKCIQEQQALITALTARVAALEAKP